MKIYTKTGDKGLTGLYGGARVWKDDPRVEAYGTIDELNAALGASIAHCRHNDVSTCLTHVQRDLFVAGADLASPQGDDNVSKPGLPHIEPRHTQELEQFIDLFDKEVPALTSFVLPGGAIDASSLHLARTICRRAERRVVTLSNQVDVNEEIVKYLNRLSDLLFVLARALNCRAEVAETLWSRNA